MYVLEKWHKQTDYTDEYKTSNSELNKLAIDNKAQLVVAYWYGGLDSNMADYALLKGDQLAYIKWSH